MSSTARGLVVTGSLMMISALIWLGCSGDQPLLVFGPNVTGNIPPSLTILDPVSSSAINQGERLGIRWTDSDSDSAALISFYLVNTATGVEIPMITSIPENDTQAADEVGVGTALVPLGTYNLRGDISDGVNATVSTFATVEGTTNTRVVLQIGEPGTNPLSVPPQVAVTAPRFNQGVAQDDSLTVTVRPTSNLNDTTTPYDPDSEATLYVLLDLDENPNNDSPLIPNEDEIIVLRQSAITQGETAEQSFNILVDLAVIPPRPDGSPYYVRATIVDVGNPAVHAYAPGTIQIVRSATGIVDLTNVGRTLSGARFQGFNPGSNLGSRMISIQDFDADGIDDFLLVAQYGNPRNFGNIGEAYLIYGLPQGRFGGTSNVNSVSSTIPGVIIEAPPNRLSQLHTDPLAKPRGITDAAVVEDLTGDGRPDVLFGMSMVDGIFQGRDDDPGDNGAVQSVNIALQAELASRLLNDNLDSGFDDDFRGVVDTYISRLQPNSSFGNSETLSLSSAVVPDDTTPGDEFILISYDATDILDVFTTVDNNNINELTVTLELSSATGTLPLPDAFTARQLRFDFNDQTNYNDFGNDGTPGPTEDAEYESDDLDVNVNFLNGTIRIDVTPTIQALLDGELSLNPGWILVPTDAITPAQSLVSSEGTTELRPRLTIVYQEQLQDDTANYGCYPDLYANNQSDLPDDPGAVANPMVDSSFEASGVMVFLASENRDTDGFIDPDRLEATVVTLELTGQENPTVGLRPSYPFLDGDETIGGFIEHRAGADDSPAGSGLLRGCRFQAGWYDYINDGLLGEAPPRIDYFGEHVASMPDVDNDSRPELIVSAPRNELYLDSITTDITVSNIRHFASTAYTGSVIVFPSADYGVTGVATDPDGNQTLPRHGTEDGQCDPEEPIARSGTFIVRGGFEVYAEDPTDFLGGARYAGDINLDGVPDIVCGAPLNDLTGLKRHRRTLYPLWSERQKVISP
jgi:hypothetical protein